MKRHNKSKGRILQVAIILTTLILTSCGSDYQSRDTKKVSEKKNSQKFDKYKEQRDAQFLVDAAALNLEGIQLGHLAQVKGSAIHVKELGKMMSEDHAASQLSLVSLAKRKEVSIPENPTEASKNAFTLLSDLPREDFDLYYSDLMVTEHRNAINKFEKAANECTDSEIKNWATSELSLLRNHLVHAVECKNKCMLEQKQ